MRAARVKKRMALMIAAIAVVGAGSTITAAAGEKKCSKIVVIITGAANSPICITPPIVDKG